MTAPLVFLDVNVFMYAAGKPQHDIRSMISADRDFDVLSFMTRIDPLDYD